MIVRMYGLQNLQGRSPDFSSSLLLLLLSESLCGRRRLLFSPSEPSLSLLLLLSS